MLLISTLLFDLFSTNLIHDGVVVDRSYTFRPSSGTHSRNWRDRISFPTCSERCSASLLRPVSIRPVFAHLCLIGLSVPSAEQLRDPHGCNITSWPVPASSTTSRTGQRGC